MKGLQNWQRKPREVGWLAAASQCTLQCSSLWMCTSQPTKGGSLEGADSDSAGEQGRSLLECEQPMSTCRCMKWPPRS